MPCKFTEILDHEEYRSTSPQDDVRLEDVIAATNMANRGRQASDASTRSPSSSSSSSSSDTADEKPVKKNRLSQLLTGMKKS